MKNRHTRERSMSSIVLERIAQVGEGMLDAFLPRGHSETHMMRAILGLDARRHISRKTFSTTLSRLKNDGLVERSGTMRCALWRLTDAGKRSLEKDRIITSDRAKKEDGIGRLVIFDIPEQERRKRDIVRSELIGADFKQLQKSVWIGYRPLPLAFIALLDDLRLKGKVHIFSIQNEGTITDD